MRHPCMLPAGTFAHREASRIESDPRLPPSPVGPHSSGNAGAEEATLARIVAALTERYGRHVLSGPFAGMTYLEQAVGSALIPKLLGSYESELHAVFAEVTQGTYPRIINIGSGEGYYAVGLALRLPEAPVYAFDPDPDARRLCATLAAQNGVSARVTLAAACGIPEIGEVVTDYSLVICDCEGCEGDLLRPEQIPSLTTCDLVVELHDFLDPRLSSLLQGRFSPTHQIRWIPTVEREPALFDQILARVDATGRTTPTAPRIDLGEAEKRLALAEFRPAAMQWAFLTPTPRASGKSH